MAAVESPEGMEPGGPFRRSMHGFGALLITLSALSPSIGLFIVGSDLLHQVGTGTLVCFAAAGLLGLAMSCVYAELGSAWADTGAEYTMCRRVIGPLPGFVVLISNLFGFSVAQALTAQGVAQYLKVAAPALPEAETALALVVVVTFVGVLNIRVNAWVTGLFLAVEIASLVVVAALGFAHPHRSLIEAIAPPLHATGAGGLATVSFAALAAAAVGGIYAFNGYGAVVGLGEELHQAPRKIAGVVFGALGVAAVTMLIPLLALQMGAADLSAILSDKAPVAAFVRAAGGAGLAQAMGLGVALAMLNAMIAVALLAGRMLYATGRDGLWLGPVNRQLARVHSRFNSPWLATLIMGATSLIWCLVPEHLLVIFLGSGNVLLYALLALGVIAGRRNGSTAHAGWRMPLFPAPAVIVLVSLLGVLWAAIGDARTGRPGVVATLAVAAGASFYWLIVLRRRRTAGA